MLPCDMFFGVRLRCSCRRELEPAASSFWRQQLVYRLLRSKLELNNSIQSLRCFVFGFCYQFDSHN